MGRCDPTVPPDEAAELMAKVAEAIQLRRLVGGDKGCI
jgi:hypothetical protein